MVAIGDRFGLRKGTRTLSGVMKLFYILTELVATQVYFICQNSELHS